MKRVFLFSLFTILIGSALVAQEAITTIILVRHAEKAAAPEADPGLTQEGSARAELLRDMFQHSGLAAIYTSQYARTRKTAEPLAQKLGLKLQTVDAAASKKLAETILSRNSGRSVMVVGHSNTLPEIIEALGAGSIAEIPETDYNSLFIVTVTQKGKGKLLRLNFFSGPAELVCQ